MTNKLTFANNGAVSPCRSCQLRSAGCQGKCATLKSWNNYCKKVSDQALLETVVNNYCTKKDFGPSIADKVRMFNCASTYTSFM